MILGLKTVNPQTPLPKMEMLGSLNSPSPSPIMDVYPSRIISEVSQDPLKMENRKNMKIGTYHCLIIMTHLFSMGKYI